MGTRAVGVLSQVAPAPGLPEDSLIATAEHSALGARWIHDGQADPLWHDRVLHLVGTNGVADPSGGRNAGFTEVRGESRTSAPLTSDDARVELVRVLTPALLRSPRTSPGSWWGRGSRSPRARPRPAAASRSSS